MCHHVKTILQLYGFDCFVLYRNSMLLTSSSNCTHCLVSYPQRKSKPLCLSMSCDNHTTIMWPTDTRMWNKISMPSLRRLRVNWWMDSLIHYSPWTLGEWKSTHKHCSHLIWWGVSNCVGSVACTLYMYVLGHTKARWLGELFGSFCSTRF